MRTVGIIPWALAILAVSSCNLRESGEMPSIQLTAQTDDGVDSRTILESGHVLWSAGDKIKVYDAVGSQSSVFVLDDADAGTASGQFSGTALAGGIAYAVYPEAIAEGCSSGKISLRLPSTQTYAESGFASGSNPAVSLADGNMLKFKNLYGIISFSLTGDAVVRKLELTSNLDEALWGAASVAMNYSASGPEIEMTGSFTEDRKTLVLDCGEGVALGSEPKSFYFVVPPGKLSAGFTLKVYDSENGSMSKTSSSSELEIVRSVRKSLSTIPYLQTESPFLSETVFGVYDLSSGSPVPVKAYSKGSDQLAVRIASDAVIFRIQCLASGYALCIELPKGITTGDNCNVGLSSIGDTGVADGSCSAVVLKRDGNKMWLLDKASAMGYIIAGEE